MSTVLYDFNASVQHIKRDKSTDLYYVILFELNVYIMDFSDFSTLSFPVQTFSGRMKCVITLFNRLQTSV